MVDSYPSCGFAHRLRRVEYAVHVGIAKRAEVSLGDPVSLITVENPFSQDQSTISTVTLVLGLHPYHLILHSGRPDHSLEAVFAEVPL